jgi:PAS domain S-box-containing protein
MTPMRLLIVEDDRSQRVLLARLLRGALEPRVVEIVETDSVSAAMRACAPTNAAFDAILLDLHLPDGEGLQTFRSVRQCATRTAVIVITGTDDPELERELIREGVQEYMVKGRFDASLLRRAIEHSVDRERLRFDLERSREDVLVRDLAFEAQYRGAPVPIYTFRFEDGDFTLVDCNDEALASTAGGALKILRKRLDELYPPGHVMAMSIREAYQSQRVFTVEFDYAFQTIDKKTVLEATFVYIPPDLVMVYAKDVGAERKALERLRASEGWLRALFDQSPIAKMVWRAIDGDDFELSDYNAAAVELGDGLIESMLGRPASSIYRDFPAVLEAMRRRFLDKSGAAETVSIEYPIPGRGVRSVDITLAYFDREGLISHYQDQTDARDAQARETFQASLLANVINSVVATDTDGTILYWNRSAEELFGWTAGEAVGQRITDLLVPPDAHELTAKLFATLPETRRFDGELRARRKDGSELPVYVTISTLADDGGRATAYVAVYFDLTELRAEQDARRKNEELLSAVLDNLPVGVFLVDGNGDVVRSNRAARAIWGIDEARWQGSYGKFRAWWPDTGQPVDDNDWPGDRTRRDRKPLLDVELEIETFTHLRRRILNSTIPLLEGDQRVASVVVNQDITDQRLTEESLRRSEELFRSLVENLSEVITILDGEGIVLYQSPSVFRSLGFQPSELIGKNVTDLLRPADVPRALEYLRDQVSHPDEVHSLSMDFRHRDGSWRTFEINTKGIGSGDSNVISTGRDVTEKNALEERLQQMDRVSSLGRVAATVAHEINNVLMGIQPFAEIIRRRAAGDPHLERASVQIGRAMQRGRRVTQEILRFTQPAVPSLQPTDIGALLEALRGEAQILLGPSVDFFIECDDGPLTAMADADQLTQVLTNLLLNARDAIEGRGQVTLLCFHDRAVTDLRSPGSSRDMVHVEVRDSGRGIQQEIADRIFDPLFTTKPRGTGLGLSVVHQIIKQHGGEIHVESRDGEGTSFHVMLPLVQMEAREGEVASAEAGSESGLRRVLLVEDDPAVSLGLSMLLESDGFSVQTVTNGADALPEVERFRPDLVLLDYGLPDMTGVDVFRLIRARWPDLAVIFSTGQGEQQALRESMETQRTGYLLKPYDLRQLIDEMRRITGE